jgi:hypothetical protein
MVKFDRVVLLTVVPTVLLLPSGTLPKFRLEALAGEVRVQFPATAIKHQRTVRKMFFDQGFLRSKPGNRFIVPPLMLRARARRGIWATALLSRSQGACGQTEARTASLYSGFPSNSGRCQKGMWHYTLVHGSACPQTLHFRRRACYGVRVGIEKV